MSTIAVFTPKRIEHDWWRTNTEAVDVPPVAARLTRSLEWLKPRFHVYDSLETQPGFFVQAARFGAEWALLMFGSDQWPAVDHPIHKLAWAAPTRGMLRPASLEDPTAVRDLERALAALPSNVESVALSIFSVEDSMGGVVRGSQPEVRLVRISRGTFDAPMDSAGNVDGTKIAHLPQFPILYQPISAYRFEETAKNPNSGDTRLKLHDVMALAKKSDHPLDQRIYFKARELFDTCAVLGAVERLFEHCCMYEELVLAENLLKNLPYTVEKQFPEEISKLWDSYHEQVKLLKKDGRWDEQGYYGDRAPVVTSINASTMKQAGYLASIRMQWLCGQLQKRGMKRIVELGSLDGFNLAQGMALMPEVSWNGLEVSEKAVAHGHALAKEIGLTGLDLRHYRNECPGPGFARRSWFHKCAHHDDTPPYDAAFCFEVLEHNHDPSLLLDACESWVKPGGRVFISTPNCAWSAFNDNTFNLTCSKEHIRVYTSKRMHRVLEERGASDIEVRDYENPNYWENNGWVFASYEVQ